MNKKFIITLCCILFAVSCVKSPSKVGPTDQYSTGNYPASLDDLNSVLAACYSNLRDANLFGFTFLTKGMANLTHTANSIYNGDPSWNEMANMNLSVTNTYVLGAWQSLYTGVKNCNVTLNAAKFYMKNYGKSSDRQQVNYIKGQAYFLRAFYYFELECLFGEQWVPNPTLADTLGVPLFTKLPTNLASTQKPRSSIHAVWALIESDLKESASLLKGKAWAGDNRGRVTEWSAKGLLGKAYVFTKDWKDAKPVLLDVIKNSGKHLIPYNEYRESFVGVSADEFNAGSLFELNVDPDSKGDYGVYGDNPNATTINGLIWCPWALGKDGTVSGAQPMGYGNEILHYKNILRFGYNLGNYKLVNNPNFNSNQPASYINPKKIMNPAYKKKALLVRKNNLCDPRLFVNALQPWVDSVKFDGKNWYPVSKPNFFAGQENKYGWSIRKYSMIYNNINNTGPAGSDNIYLLRLADVYLLYAEACMHTGDNPTALEYLNKVKRRAYGYPVNQPSPIDYTSLTDTTSAINDPVLGHNPLYYERWAELFNEGQWWFDVCRWHLGASEAAYYGTALNLTGPIQWNNKTYAWPIPLKELNSNPKMAGEQNPGY